MLQRNPDRQVQSDGAVPYWRLWSATFLGFSAIGMTIQVMPAYAHERLGANAIVAGLAVTIGSLATMISRPVSGRFADQSGGRRVAMAGAILGLIGGIGHLVATNLPVLVLARLFLGAGEGALFTGSVGWILAHTSNRSAVRSQGILACRCGWGWPPGQCSEPHYCLSAPIATSGLPRALSRCSPGCWLHRHGPRACLVRRHEYPSRPVSKGSVGTRRVGRIRQHWIRNHRCVSGATLRGS